MRVWPEAAADDPALARGRARTTRPAGGDERWTDGRVSNVHDPTLTYLAPIGPATGTAVIVAPGGGYARLAMANEAAGVAERLRAAGRGDVRPEVPARRLPVPGAAAGRAARGADRRDRAPRSSACGPIGSA